MPTASCALRCWRRTWSRRSGGPAGDAGEAETAATDELEGAAPPRVAAKLPAVPLAGPDVALAVCPHASRPLTRCRRIDPVLLARGGVDLGDVRARERSVENTAVGRRRDAIRAAAVGILPDAHGTRRRVEATVDSCLPGEPQVPFAIESSSIEVGVARILRQRPSLDLFGTRIDG